jgi:hypothetical protein
MLLVMSFNYGDSPYPLPDRIPGVHRDAWAALARPGMWWSGAERVAIAEETRNAESCALCAERRDALSAPSVVGEHASTTDLPAAAIEAVHKIVTDPGRLSKEWLTGLLADGLADAAYVEIVSVLTTVISIDDVHRGLGLSLGQLPTAEAGEPERRRPAGAADEGAWVETVPADALDPEDADLYGGRPFAANVIRALSLVPPAVRTLDELHGAHYLSYDEMQMMTGLDRSLSRPQLELVAARVSAVNECFY